MNAASQLGGYLRARRALVQPGDAGFPAGTRRRVTGLRREELASLAGVSADYLVRLEQGRDHRPSREVLDALARALQLDAPSTAYLHRLAERPRSATSSSADDEVALGLRELLVTVDGLVSAFVQSPFMDVLVANDLATALSPSFSAGSNLVRSAFLDPAVRQLYPDWEVVVREAVAGLRVSAQPYGDDPRLAELIAELTEASPAFRDLWSRHDVVPKVAGSRRVVHPLVGPLDLLHEKLLVPGSPGQLLVLHHAPAGSAAAGALADLADMIRGADAED